MVMFVIDVIKKKVYEVIIIIDVKRVEIWLIKKFKNKLYLLMFKIGFLICFFFFLVLLYLCSNRNNI